MQNSAPVARHGEGDAASAALAAPGAEAEARTANVLIIDDDAALARMVRFAMLSHGYRVRTAGHGAEGLERVAEQLPDVIVLDLQMPVMDGRTFYRELRARGIDTPVVILSAYGAGSAQAELGAEAHVNKPFDPDDLVRAIQRVLP
jgi:CheY-like chemotaxis protein